MDRIPKSIAYTSLLAALVVHALPLHAQRSDAPTPVAIRRLANVESDAQGWMAPYLERAADIPETAGLAATDIPPVLPTDFLPWWDARVRRPTGIAENALPISVDWLVQSALEHSPYVQAVSTEPHIRRTQLVEEQAQFDWRAYLNSTFNDTNDPIGNTLTTGNNDRRFREHLWSGESGLKRRDGKGGELQLSQRVGRQANNSRFLVPQPQGTSRLELSYSQPLLSGSGRAYNQSRIVLANIEANAADDDVVLQLQEHLLKVTQAYWELYRARAQLLQRNRVLHDATGILGDLMNRQQFDSLERQILRARAAVANRRSEIARAATSIRNAESQLRLLVNDPALMNSGRVEFTPTDPPASEEFNVVMRDGLNTALLNRADVSRAIRNMRATTTRLGVAKNEILPQLDLMVSTYVAGLEGQSRVLSAIENQFNQGRPSYSVGLQFEAPLGNRAARARLERRQWEMVRATSEFRVTVEQALTETEVAIREIDTAHREMVGKYEAMMAADTEANYLEDRWKTLPGFDNSTTLLLEDLLDAQERRADQEAAFVQSQVNYAVALVRLRQAMGTLLKFQDSTSPTGGRPEEEEFLPPATGNE